jgi:MarR family transcriptional regulator for hemolysin
MERDGLLNRRRDPENRRVHIVELTSAGEELFEHLRDAAVEFDRRLRTKLSEDDTSRLRELLTQISENVRAPV